MKYELLILLVLLMASVSHGAEPRISCVYGFNEEGYYKVDITVTGPDGYDSFTNCPGVHEPNHNSTSVQIANFIESSLAIPSIVCSYFPNIRRLTANEAGLNQTRHVLDCFNLQELDLSQNRILTLESNAFATNQQLKVLNLANNQITSTNDHSLYQLVELEYLNLSNNPIELQPRFFEYNRKLRTLYLNNCGLTSIETFWFSNMSSLLNLNLSDNLLDSSLDDSTFSNLHNLQTLNLADCSINSLPGDIFHNNQNLRYLNLMSNDLTTLSPNTLQNLTELETLILSVNTFDSLPDEIFLSLTSLKHLYMNQCNIKSLKLSWFSTLENLSTLSLEGNSIEQIPYGTFGVENFIKTLYLSNNKLRILDATSFARLNHLTDLRVTNNQIFAVDSHFLQQPESLGNAWFLYNECVNLNIQNFYREREDNMKKFANCFDNFDRIPVDFVTRANDAYRWFSVRWNTTVVHIKADESAQLIFSHVKSENSDHTLEIHLGMERNYVDRIYENGVEKWQKVDRNVLKADEWVSFVVSWNFNVLTVFKQGYQLPFAIHIIEDPFVINFFGIRSASDTNSSATWHINKMEDNFLHDEFPIPISPTTTTEVTTISSTLGTSSTV